MLMNRLTFLILCLIGISNGTFSQLKLDIEISEIKNDKGNIMLQIFDDHGNVIKQGQKPVKDNLCLFTFANLSPGKYAVRYYHDENQNRKMETNILGKPTEGYGFSNNVVGKFGPPPFKKWLFELIGDKKIVLKPTY
jgi:uncharacterized protein (DUF2141 family)